MDFETPTSPKVEAGDQREESGDAPRLFFAGEEIPDNRLYNLGHAPVSPRARTTTNRSIVRTALFAAGACCLGLFIYGVSSGLKKGHSTSTTYRFTLPPTQSAAAVHALPPPNLLKPLSPEEASKENAERPFVSRLDSPASRFLLKTDTEDRARALTCLAQAAYYEAAGEGVDGERAVAQVVLNRMRHPGFPSTICGVVYEGADRGTGCQFSFTCDGSMQRVPITWLWKRSTQIAEEALKGRVFAPIGHATHYHADYVLPYWADSLDKSIQIGRHIFYRLRSSLGDARAFSQHYGGTEPPFREPGATFVIPQTDETKQLGNALISDGTQGSVPDVLKASLAPSSPLLVDSGHGTLLADSADRPTKSERPKATSQCIDSVEHKKVSALKADDLRASLDGPSC